MAVTFIEERKKQRNLIWIFIIIVLIMVVIWWQGFFKKPSLKGIEIPVFEFKKIEINFEVLENPILKELQLFEKIQPYEGEIGRADPFLPY